MRHGETDWNKKKLVQGRKDIPLNEYGRHLARETSYGMRQYQIDLAYTSPCLLYTSPSPRDLSTSRMPSSA